MDRKQFKSFLKKFIVCVAIVVLFVFFLWRIDLLTAFLNKLLIILRPLIIGCIIAFVLNKPVMRIQRLYKSLFNKKTSFNKRGKEKTYYILSILTVYVLFIALITGIICFVVPQLISSVRFFSDSFDTYYANFSNFFETYFSHFDFGMLEKLDLPEKFSSWVSGLTSKIPEIITTTFGITKNIINYFVDIFVGLIFSIYVLSGKKNLKNQTGRVFRAILAEKSYKKLVDFYNLVSNTFSNFINGQLTEACILGILCFIGMSVFGFEYSVLISVIIGITNLIPIFGPIFGTIPCALILLLVDPVSAVWFVVFIIVLQQIDSNLIYPRVVGGLVGLAPFWTLAAIIIGGGMFGVVGMLLAVPFMSIIYVTVRDAVNKRLKKKKETSENVSQIKAQ